jgi:hypothetical protein
MQLDPGSVSMLFAQTLAASPDVAMKAVLTQPLTWAILLQFSILCLGQAFESLVESVEEVVDPKLIPVVKQSVEEFATLGFIGLVIQTFEIGRLHTLLACFIH